MIPIVTTAFLTNTPILGGTARILQYWLRLGKERGLDGRVVLRAGSDFIEWGRSQGIDLLVDPMPWPERRKPWSSLWHASRVARWGKRSGVNIIHCNEHNIYPFVGVLKNFLKRPTVCHVRYKLDRGFAEWAFRGNRCPDALLWTSYQQKADSAAAVAGIVPEERQHVVRLGVDLEVFGNDVTSGRELRKSWGIADDEVLIGLPSPLRPRKRIEDFISVVRTVAAGNEKAVGVIAGGEVAGDEEYRQKIERLISESGLGRRLRWVGYLDPVEPFQHACDISVSTSEYETFGNSVCEAMACGKPVVGYVGGSVAEVVGDSGIVVPTGDIDALTRAVDQLTTNPDLRRSLGASARQRVAAEFSPAASFAQIHEIYNRLVSRV